MTLEEYARRERQAALLDKALHRIRRDASAYIRAVDAILYRMQIADRASPFVRKPPPPPETQRPRDLHGIAGLRSDT